MGIITCVCLLKKCCEGIAQVYCDGFRIEVLSTTIELLRQLPLHIVTYRALLYLCRSSSQACTTEEIIMAVEILLAEFFSKRRTSAC